MTNVPGFSLVAGYIDEATEQQLLGEIDALPFSTELSRRVQHHGYRYDYKARSASDASRLGPLPPWAEALAEGLLSRGFFANKPDQVIVNEYEPGQGIAAHVDCVGCFGPVVASLSLGASCELELAPVGGGEPVSAYLTRRSLFVLEGDARYRYTHAIKKRKSDVIGGLRAPRGRRVSVTFRTMKLA